MTLLTRVQYAYLGLFFFACAGVYAYEALYVWPAQKCESNGGWWDPKDRACATPVPIWRITGRKPAPATPLPPRR
jgi:hypothetical protein